MSSFLKLVTLTSILLLSCKKETIEPPIQAPYDAEHDYKNLSEMEILGKKIFFDKNLSSPAGQSCSSCHSINDGFTDPDHLAFSKGAISSFFGNRSAPSIAYMKYSPSLYFDNIDSTYIGGLFWDGRVNSMETQALKPMFNPIEMNNSTISQVVAKLKNSEYGSMFLKIYGQTVFDDTLVAIQFAAASIAAFERSSQVNPFSSKYDSYLNGEAQLSDQELRGLALFNDTIKTKCLNCHPSGTDNAYGLALFTDFSYDNIGLPHNPASPTAAPDYGLGTFLNNVSMNGKFKVPTLRNVAITAPYFHNGYFTTLEDAVTFYARRDSTGLYPAAEVNQNVNKDELGKLPLSNQEIKDLVAFLKTLTDGYKK